MQTFVLFYLVEEMKNVTCFKAENKAVALVLLHFSVSFSLAEVPGFICSPAFLKNFQWTRGFPCYYSVPEYNTVLLFRAFFFSLFLPSFFSPVTHARQRCSTAELGGTSALKLGFHTKLTMIFFSPSISACKCLPLYCRSSRVCIGTAGFLEFLFALCSHYILI